MVRRQRLDCGAKISQILVRRADSEQAAVLLHHIDSCPAVACVDSQAHCAAWTHHVSKRAKTLLRVRQMMQHSRTNHQVERASNLPDALDRELMQLEVLKIVLT